MCRAFCSGLGLKVHAVGGRFEVIIGIDFS